MTLLLATEAAPTLVLLHDCRSIGKEFVSQKETPPQMKMVALSTFTEILNRISDRRLPAPPGGCCHY
jgi:hypothetical protein